MASRRNHTKPKTSSGAIVSEPTARRRSLPRGYAELLEDLKTRIRTAQVKAVLSVNRELIQLYWDIGRAIVLQQRAEGWGFKVIDGLAADLQREFPGEGGFSRTNVYRMRSFFLAYVQATEVVPQAVGRSSDVIVPQAVGQLAEVPVPPIVAEIPWGHNVVLLEHLKDPAERLWYAQQTITNGWSRSVLTHWIESDLYARQGKAVSNFKLTLPPSQSDLAHHVLKDPYNFDFLTLRKEALEREVEEGLLAHIRRFLLEMGAGFALVGQQYHLEVGGEDFYIDLLFYHLKLRCYLVVDLKVEPFKPEFAGKMNFYLSAVDDLLRHPDDKPSVGLILCKTRNRVIAEYALRDLNKPVGVSRYLTKLVESLPAAFRKSLPSSKLLKEELRKKDERQRRF